MEAWWEENKGEFTKRGMKFGGHACVTTTKGKPMKSGGHMYDEEYAESEEKVRKLITDNISAAPRNYDPSLKMKNITTALQARYTSLRRAVIGGGNNAFGSRDTELSWLHDLLSK
jgi:hypothetical protein